MKILLENDKGYVIVDDSTSKITYCGAEDDVKPLISCGARVVIETESDVQILN